MVDPLMAHLLGDLIKKLKKQLKLTSIVVTHDMALAKKLADRLLFLHEAKAIFFGTFEEMANCQEPIVQEFLDLDSWTSSATSARNGRRTSPGFRHRKTEAIHYREHGRAQRNGSPELRLQLRQDY